MFHLVVIQNTGMCIFLLLLQNITHYGMWKLCTLPQLKSESLTQQLSEPGGHPGYSLRFGSLTAVSGSTHAHLFFFVPGSYSFLGTPAHDLSTPPLFVVHHTREPWSLFHSTLHGGFLRIEAFQRYTYSNGL